MSNEPNIVEIDLSTNERTLSIFANYQYDRGIKARLTNVPDLQDCSLILEMCNSGDKIIKHTVTYSGEDVLIPENLLSDGKDILIYLFVKGDNWGKTVLEVTLRINRRPSR